MRKVRPKGPLHPPGEFESFSSKGDEVSPMMPIFEFLSPVTNLSSSPESCSGLAPQEGAGSLKWALNWVLHYKGVLCDSPFSCNLPPHRGGVTLWPPSQPSSFPVRLGGEGRAARDRYLWKASERLSNPPPANRRQDVSTKETAGQLAASFLPRPQPSFFLSFHSLSS